MNENDFIGTIAGRVRWVYNRRYCFFRANQLPFAIRVNVRLRRRFRNAMMSLCRLDGRMQQISEREREMVSKVLMTREAICSSAIDSQSPDIDDVLYPSNESEEGRSAEDVGRYVEALRFAFSDSSGSSKITSFTITEIHKRLLDTREGRLQSPGEMRFEQNFIGGRGDTLETARFVPADPMSLPSLMENMMKYVNTSADDPLYKIALVHYQFEAIHPLRDGNGRMGRLLIAAMMFSEGIMTCSTVPISEYLYEHRKEYLDSLYDVSAKDDFDKWFSLFLDAVTIQSERSAELIDRVLSLRNRLLDGETNQNRRKVIDSMFDNPYRSVSEIMDVTGLTRPGALKLISFMEQEGLLEEVSGRKRGRVYLADSIRSAEYE